MSANKKVYSLKNEFGTFLWGRHIAVALRDQVFHDAPRDVVFDFKGVTFITRAFADELQKVQKLLERKGIKSRVTNAAPDVNSMFNLVATAVHH